jgi:hypothetical protein
MLRGREISAPRKIVPSPPNTMTISASGKSSTETLLSPLIERSDAVEQVKSAPFKSEVRAVAAFTASSRVALMTSIALREVITQVPSQLRYPDLFH